MTETQLQVECVRWMWNNLHEERLMWHHNDNNSHNKVEGNKKKAMGVVAGVWDFEWVTPYGRQVWIEFKINGNGLTDLQKEFKRKMELRFPSALWVIIETALDFKLFIIKHNHE